MGSVQQFDLMKGLAPRMQGSILRIDSKRCAHPGDDWRFTPDAGRNLFAQVGFDQRLSRFHTDWSRTMGLEDAGGDLNTRTMFLSAAERADKTARGRLRRVGFSLLRRLFGLKTNMLYSTMFDMVGFKKG